MCQGRGPSLPRLPPSLLPHHQPVLQLLLAPPSCPHHSSHLLFQVVFYSIVSAISVGCVAIISLSLAHRGDLALAINNVLWCLVPALFLATYYRQRSKALQGKL